MIVTTLMVLGALVWTEIDARECRSDEEKIYVLSDKGAVATWTEALGECGRRGMSLATIKNDEEFKSYHDTLIVSGRLISENFYLGASCEGACAPGNKNGWYWITDNTKLASSEAVNNNWAAGEPDFMSGTQQILITLGSGMWDDVGYAQYQRGWACHKCLRKVAPKQERTSF